MPIRARHGALLVRSGETVADLTGWVDGAPLERLDVPLALTDARDAFRDVGSTLARLHVTAGGWTPPDGFVRPCWFADVSA